MTCFAAKSTTHEPIETLLLIKGQLCFVTSDKLVKTTLIGNQCSFVRLHCQTKEEREVGFHLSMAGNLACFVVPESWLKRFSNEFRIGDTQSLAIGGNEVSQNTVTLVDSLESEWPNTAIKQFLSDVRKTSSPVRAMRHFHAAARRAYSL